MTTKPYCTTGYRTWSLRSQDWSTWSLTSNVALYTSRICACRGGAVVMSPVGVHQVAGASSGKSDRDRSTVQGSLRLCGIGSRGQRNRMCIGPNRWHEYVCTTGCAQYSRNSLPKGCKRPLHFQSDRGAHSSLLTKNQLCGPAAELVHGSP